MIIRKYQSQKARKQHNPVGVHRIMDPMFRLPPRKSLTDTRMYHNRDANILLEIVLIVWCWEKKGRN